MKYFTFILIFALASCSQSKDYRGEIFERKKYGVNVLNSGLADFQRDRALNTVAHKYGFNYHRIGGCIIDESAHDSLTRENNKAIAFIERKLGLNWRVKLNAETDSMLVNQMKIDSLVFNNYQIKEFQLQHKEITNLFTNIEFTKTEYIYEVDLLSWELELHQLKRYFNVVVNIEDNHIEFDRMASINQ